jgi:hypothetical protein
MKYDQRISGMLQLSTELCEQVRPQPPLLTSYNTKTENSEGMAGMESQKFNLIRASAKFGSGSAQYTGHHTFSLFRNRQTLTSGHFSGALVLSFLTIYDGWIQTT